MGGWGPRRRGGGSKAGLGVRVQGSEKQLLVGSGSWLERPGTREQKDREHRTERTGNRGTRERKSRDQRLGNRGQKSGKRGSGKAAELAEPAGLVALEKRRQAESSDTGGKGARELGNKGKQRFWSDCQSWNQYAPEGGNNRQIRRQEFARVFSGLRGGEEKKRLTKSGGTSRSI